MGRHLRTRREPEVWPGSKTFLCVHPYLHRGHRCITWSYVLIPAAQPGRFSVDGGEAERVTGGREGDGRVGGALVGRPMMLFLCPPPQHRGQTPRKSRCMTLTTMCSL